MKRILCVVETKTGWLVAIVVIVMVVILVLGVWNLRISRRAYYHRAEDDVREKAKEIAISMVAYHVETGHYPVPELAMSADYAVQAVREIERCYFHSDSIQTNNLDGVDQWRQPYKLIIRGVGANDELLDSIHPNATIAVWSIGKNRKNEYGKGDDIVYWYEQ